MITVIKNASYVIGFENGSHCIYKDGEVAFQEDRIIFVGKEYPGEAQKMIDARGGIVSPGLIDMQVDLQSTLLEKSNIEDTGNPFHFMDDQGALTELEDVEKEDQLAMTEFSLAELLSKGVTTVFVKGNGDEDVIDRVGKSGVRAVYSPVVSSCRLSRWERKKLIYEKQRGNHGISDLEQVKKLREKYEGSYDGRMSIALGLRSSDTCDPELLDKAAKLLEDDSSMLCSIGAAQTVDEFVEIAYRYGITPADYLHNHGIYGPRVIYVNYMMRSGHNMNTMILGDEIDRIARDRTNVVNCPWRYGRRGIVMESFQKYHDAGINMGLGTDSSSLDMMLEMRYASIFCKYAEHVNPLKGKAGIIFNAATVNAARALGREDIGRLQAGAKADLIIVDIKNLDCSPMRDPIKSLVFTATGKNVTHVFVDGMELVDETGVKGMNKKALVRAVQDLVGKYKNDIPMSFPIRQ